MSRPVALITGASMGIGEQIAHVAAADEHDVILVARSAEKLEDLAAALSRRHGIEARVEALDLAAPGAAEQLCDRLSDVDIDVLVNNAGLGSRGAFNETPLDRVLLQVDLNMRVLTELTHRILPSMLRRRRGRILNIASLAAFQGGPWMSVYYATKAYVLTFTEGLAGELAGTGVTATAQCPGATKSEFGRTAGSADTLLFRLGVAEADDVAEHAWRAAMKGRTVAVHGFTNQITRFGVRFAPRRLASVVAGRLNQ